MASPVEGPSSRKVRTAARAALSTQTTTAAPDELRGVSSQDQRRTTDHVPEECDVELLHPATDPRPIDPQLRRSIAGSQLSRAARKL